MIRSDDAFSNLPRRAQIRGMRQAAREALELFAIEYESLRLLDHFDNTTFAVTTRDGGRLVLQLIGVEDASDPHSRRRVESELWWLSALRTDLDLPVPEPVATPAGDPVVTVPLDASTARLCTLFRWVEGRFVHRGLTPAHLAAVGRLTARLHEHSVGLAVPPDFERRVVDRADAETEEAASRAFASSPWPEGADIVRRAFARARRAQEELGSRRDSFGVIHADIHQYNYLFGAGQARLIDFGDCGWGHYLYDLAVTLSVLGSPPHGAKLRAGLLAGYREVRNLTVAHEALIDAFIVLREAQDLVSVLGQRENPAFERWTSRIGEQLAALEKLLAADA